MCYARKLDVRIVKKQNTFSLAGLWEWLGNWKVCYILASVSYPSHVNSDRSQIVACWLLDTWYEEE